MESTAAATPTQLFAESPAPARRKQPPSPENQSPKRPRQPEQYAHSTQTPRTDYATRDSAPRRAQPSSFQSRKPSNGPATASSVKQTNDGTTLRHTSRRRTSASVTTHQTAAPNIQPSYRV